LYPSSISLVSVIVQTVAEWESFTAAGDKQAKSLCKTAGGAVVSLSDDYGEEVEICAYGTVFS
jgi:hypothetical protein